MKGTILVVVVAIAAALTTANVWASTQQASVRWPVDCPHMRCVNRHLNNLNERLVSVESRLARVQARNRALHKCIAEYPVTRYTTYDNYTIPFDSNSDGNDDAYNWYSQQINYLGQTAANDAVGSWVLRDSCSTAVFGRPPSP